MQRDIQAAKYSTNLSDPATLALSWENLTWEDALNLALNYLRHGDFEQRWEMIKIFPKLGQRAIAPLLSIWENNSEELELRWFVGRILGQFSQPEVILSLVKILEKSEQEELSTIASESLANLGQQAVTSLIPLLLTDNQETRLLVIKALAQIRSPETIPPLLSILKDSNPEIRALAIESLGSFHQEQITETLIQGLQDKSSKVRKEAVKALGFRHHTEINPTIIAQIKPLLSDINPEVCQETALSLGRMATLDAIEALFPLLKSPATPSWLKLPIIRALNWCQNKKAIFYLSEALNWVDIYLSEEIILNLGRQVQPELKQQASTILINYLFSRHQALQSVAIRQKIAISLGNLEQQDALQALQLLSQDNEETVKLHADYALKQLHIQD